MPDRHGFNHLPMHGTFELRCAYCNERGPLANERALARHARTHRRDIAAARIASDRELATASAALTI